MKYLETERLILRHFEIADAGQMHALLSDRETMRLAGLLPESKNTAETEKIVRCWADNDRRYAVTAKSGGSVLGYIAVNPDSEEGREDTRELGFALASEYRGKGYMQEAAAAVLSKLKDEGIRYVWACCIRENADSEKLIRRCGFVYQQEGVFKAPNDRVYDSLEFRMTLQ